MPDQYDHTLALKWLPCSDPRLGRHVNHDSSSRRFAAPAVDPRTLLSVRHKLNIGVMNQGSEGSCTGHSGFNVLASDEFWPRTKKVLGDVDPHLYARGIYCSATEIDPWPGTFEPDDTGSDGLSVAKVLKNRGLISGYLHAFSLEATLTALAKRPVMIGVGWRQNMYYPDSDGYARAIGPDVGGHEFTLDELDVENERVGFTNSWGEQWGMNGRAYISWTDLAVLLADAGDATILIPVTEPPPVPVEPIVPVPPPPLYSAEDLQMAEALHKMVDNKSCPTYMRTAALKWLEAKQL